MKNIIFVCHGNICRSVAAEFIMKQMINELGRQDDFNIISRAVSLEEIGNDIYPPMKNELYREGIKFEKHYAQRINKADYDWADVIYYMDDSNKYYLDQMFIDAKNKIKPIYQYASNISHIEDPWYSDRYELVVKQLKECIKGIIGNI